MPSHGVTQRGNVHYEVDARCAGGISTEKSGEDGIPKVVPTAHTPTTIESKNQSVVCTSRQEGCNVCKPKDLNDTCVVKLTCTDCLACLLDLVVYTRLVLNTKLQM